MVPHLITASHGPINELEQRILDSLSSIERWFRLEWMEHTPPFYTSVDLRNAGFKLAPVDTNLFPAGFHNLAPQMLPLAVQAAMAAIEKICPEAKNLLLVPDRQTPGPGYLANLQQLVRIFETAGLNVRLGTLDESVAQPTEYPLPGGETLTLEPLVRTRGRLGLKNFDPCTILLNNDLSADVPKVLRGLHEQYLLPPLHAGWATRRKANHFQAYEELAKKFSKSIGLDPWLITPMFARCAEVDFRDGSAAECIATQAEALFAKIRRKYKEYGVQDKPFLIVKGDDGSVDLGFETLHDVRDVAAFVQRASDVHARSGVPVGVRDLVIQEGVPTHERVQEAPAEPVVCMIDRYVVGGFYRVHAGRGVDRSLNGPGERFVPMALAEPGALPRAGARAGASAPNRFYLYGVIARLAMVAASYELEATDPEAEVYA